MSERPLRIGIFVMMFPQWSETFIVTRVLKLLDAGFDVHVFAVQESPHWDGFEILRSRDDVRARVHVVPPLTATKALTRGAWELAKTAATHPAEFSRYVAHTWRVRHELPAGFLKGVYLRMRYVAQDLDVLHVEFDYQGFNVVDLKEYFHCHLLCSARATYQSQTVQDTMPDSYARIFRYVDGYHFISHFVEDNTHRLGLSEDVPTWLVEPAIDLSLFAKRARIPLGPGEPIRIVSVGRLAWGKGYEYSLDAIAQVRRAGMPVQFTICGSGPYEEAIRFAIKQLGLDDCVTLTGYLRREDMPRIYENADIMVHAALEEAFCNAVIEAQAMEVPVVTSDAGGLPENVEDGVTGFVVPRRDSDAMAARILELARDPTLRQRLGAAGRTRALARFDLDRQAEAFVRLYTELAALPRRPVRPA